MKNDTGGAPAVEAQGLCKRYREVTAVDGLDLAIGTGEIYGFLGRNGAGKTTTIRMLLGLIRPTHGAARLFGRDVATERRVAIAATGSLVESATFYPSLTVRENLEIQRRLTGSPAADVGRALALLTLEEYADRRAGRLSLGNKQRLALARALLHRPRLLVLDEPANGLDPAGIVEIRRLLRRLAAEDGVTVFISSHILGEVLRLADRIGIIHRGKLVEEFDPKLTGDAAGGVIEIRTTDADRALALLQSKLPEAQTRVREAGVIEVTAGHGPPPAAALIAKIIVEAGLGLEALIPREEDLEARFLRLTGGVE